MIQAASGGVMAAPQFGMPSVLELKAGDLVRMKAYAARLTRMLIAYEPRLLQPSVQVVPGDDPLQPYQLVVRGALSPDAPELRAISETRFTATGASAPPTP